MISPVARLQVRLGIIPVYEPRSDFAPRLNVYPDAWDHIPVRQYTLIDRNPAGIEWEPMAPYLEQQQRVDDHLSEVDGLEDE